MLTISRAFRVIDRRAVTPAGRPHKQVLLVAGLAYFADPFSWGGHTLFGQLLVPSGLASAAIDLVVWMSVAFAGVFLGERLPVQPSTVPEVGRKP